jgi:hypothetical protein
MNPYFYTIYTKLQILSLQDQKHAESKGIVENTYRKHQ